MQPQTLATTFGSLIHIKLPFQVNGPAKYSHVELPKLYHHMLIMPSQFCEVITINPPTFLLRNFPDIAQIHSNRVF